MIRSRPGKVGLAVCCTLCLSFIVPAVAAGSAAAVWHLDEGRGQAVGDASGNGNFGVLGLTSSADVQDPSWIPGRIGRALRFVGDSNQSVTVRPGPELRPQRLTVQAWVRRDGSPGQWRYIVSMGGVACDRSSYGLYSGVDGGVAFYVSDDSRYVLSPAVGAAIVWDGQWHLVTGSFDGAHVRLFLDGSQVGAGTPTSLQISYSFPAQNLLIGTYRAACDLPFTGDIDEVAVWGSALTPGQIEEQTRAVAAVPAPPDAVAPVSGAPPGPGGEGQPSSRALVPCLVVTVNARTIRLGRRARITVRVSHGKRPAARALVSFKGPGVNVSRLTDRAGKVRVVLRPLRRGKVRVTVRGQPLRCAGTIVTAR
jgi:hypothetical protein